MNSTEILVKLTSDDINDVSESIAKYTSQLISKNHLKNQENIIKATYSVSKKKFQQRDKLTRKFLVNTLIDLFDQKIINDELLINMKNLKNINIHLLHKNKQLEMALKKSNVPIISSPKVNRVDKNSCTCL